MAFVKVYSGARALLVNLERVDRVEPHGNGSLLYYGAVGVMVDCTLADLEAHLGDVVPVGAAPAPPKPKESEYTGAPDYGVEGPDVNALRPREERE